ITDLFRAGDISEEAFLERRREVVGKDFDDLKAWLDTYNGKVLPGSPLQTAINYPLDRWEALNKFLDFPFATSGNQLAICASIEDAQELLRLPLHFPGLRLSA
ncbi:MAG: transposase, partial [Sphaerochaeta sp.]|nr:transposase [Sphaerochaeta sp.]